VHLQSHARASLGKRILSLFVELPDLSSKTAGLGGTLARGSEARPARLLPVLRRLLRIALATGSPMCAAPRPHRSTRTISRRRPRRTRSTSRLRSRSGATSPGAVRSGDSILAQGAAASPPVE
jgi:hypothetical protein